MTSNIFLYKFTETNGNIHIFVTNKLIEDYLNYGEPKSPERRIFIDYITITTHL